MGKLKIGILVIVVGIVIMGIIVSEVSALNGVPAHSKISLPANSLKNDFVDFHGFLI